MLPLTGQREPLAKISYQRFFRRYLRLAGMTGTAREVAGEMWAVYRLNVVRVPTNRPIARQDLDDVIYKTKKAKNKAIVGENAFAHEAGIHQDGILKERTTYEIMHPEDVGISGTDLVLGKHSGRNAFRSRLEELGITFDTEEELNAAFSRFKDLADKKHEIFDEDLQALVTDRGIDAENERIRLVALRVVSETGETPNADVTLSIDGKECSVSAEGGGPVDAAYRAIESLVNTGADLKLYSVNNITSGTDSQGEVTVRLEKGGNIVNGQGADTDIVIASARAYVNGLNKIIRPEDRQHPQRGDV